MVESDALDLAKFLLEIATEKEGSLRVEERADYFVKRAGVQALIALVERLDKIIDYGNDNPALKVFRVHD